MAWVALSLHICLSGCGAVNKSKDITGVAGGRAVQARQSSPTEIQGLVMAFADKYAARAADGYDRIHDQAQTIEVRRYAREAKVSAGWGALTIATEINPVASMLDMVTMVRLRRKSFEDHGVALLPPEPAQIVRTMHQQSEDEVWLLAGRFLTDQQMEQLRGVIDAWYESNSELRTVAHLKLLDFASFRRESTVSNPSTPANVLALLYLDPLASMDPVQREISESRLFAERTLFFAKRVSTLGFWQVQLVAVDMLMIPEMRDLMARSEKLTADAERFVTATERFTAVCERFAKAWEQMPREADQILTNAIAELHKALAAEREAAIEQSATAIDTQRNALIGDMNAVEGSARNVLADVSKTLYETQQTASAVSASAKDAVASAQVNLKDVIELIYRRALTLLVVILLGIPAAMILHRLAMTRLFGSGGHVPAAPDRPERSA